MVLRFGFCLLVLGALSGCVLLTGPGLFAAGMATIINTKKTPSDHAVSWMTGQDCSSVKYSQGRAYCAPTEEAKARADGRPFDDDDRPETYGPYCYRTLGSVTCYREPDPDASEQARLQ